MASLRRACLGLVIAACASTPLAAQCLEYEVFPYSAPALPTAFRETIVWDFGAGPRVVLATATAGQPPIRVWDGAALLNPDPAVSGTAYAFAVYDAGAGPRLYAAGLFTLGSGPGSVVAHVVRWNGAQFEAVGTASPSNTSIRDLEVHDDGSGLALYASSWTMTAMQGSAATRIARWNGTIWSAVGAGLDAEPHGLGVADLGSGPRLVAGVQVSPVAGSLALVRVWDGTAWSTLGGGLPATYDGLSLTTARATRIFGLPAGRLTVTGHFTLASPQSGQRIGVWTWDGNAWSVVPTTGLVANFAEPCFAEIFDSGNGPRLHVIARGQATRLVREDGASGWTQVGATLAGSCTTQFGPGSVFYLGSVDWGQGPRLSISTNGCTVLGSGVRGLNAAYDGQQWVHATPAEAGIDSEVIAVTSFDAGSGPALVVGGTFCSADGRPAAKVARRTDAGWREFRGDLGSSSRVEVLATSHLGPEARLVAGGRFYLSGQHRGGVCVHDGTGWSLLGGGLSPSEATVYALLEADLGGGPRLYVGGDFTYANGLLSTNIASWNGTQWIPMPSTGTGGVNGAVHALAVHSFGSGPELVLGGAFSFAASSGTLSRIARWNGSTFQGIGGGMNGDVWALASFDDGTGPALIAAGNFTAAGGTAASRVARFNGAQWQPMGAGFNALVTVLQVFDDGSGPALYAAGNFSASGAAPIAHVARWDGSAWTSVGNGVGPSVQGAAVHADGPGSPQQLVLVGDLDTAGALATSSIAIWRGCGGSVDEFCFADGGNGVCPCRNDGTAGCDNSAGTLGARLAASGTTSPDALVLAVDGLLPSATTLLFQGSTLLAQPVPFGDGLRCVGGNLVRIEIGSAVAGALQFPAPGSPSISTRSAAAGDPLVPGTVRGYQAWYRDPVVEFCTAGGTSNASNAVRVAW